MELALLFFHACLTGFVKFLMSHVKTPAQTIESALENSWQSWQRKKLLNRYLFIWVSTDILSDSHTKVELDKSSYLYKTDTFILLQ